MALHNAIKFRRPATSPDAWFSIFLIHQNRDNRSLRARSGNTTAECLLPDFLDLVVWGHEHESVPEAARAGGAADSTTFVVQPGSTVATSLSDGEAAPKHTFLVEVRGSQFRTTAIPLRCIRPFLLRDVSLALDARLTAEDADVDFRIRQYLEAEVRY